MNVQARDILITHSTSRATPTNLIQIYLQRLLHRALSLPLALIDDDMYGLEPLSLDKIYVNPDTTSLVGTVGSTYVSSDTASEVTRIFRDELGTKMTAAEAVNLFTRLALLGDPGSGKSAFVRRVAAVHAHEYLKSYDSGLENASTNIPIFIHGRDLGSRLAEQKPASTSDEPLVELSNALIPDQIKEDLDHLRIPEVYEELEQLMQEGNIILIIDGLDEVPLGNRAKVRSALLSFLRIYHNLAKVIVTCRTRSYLKSTVLPGFRAEILAPFDQAKILSFVENWYEQHSISGSLSRAEAKKRASDLSDAILYSDLLPLASNPLLLTTMAALHKAEVTLPRERARLYSRIIDLLITRWQEPKGIPISSSLKKLLGGSASLRKVTEKIAYEMHCRKGYGGGDITRSDLLSLLESMSQFPDIGVAAEFIDYIDQRAGILIGRGGTENAQHPASYAFAHLVFQEYLAGSFIAGKRTASRIYFQHAVEGELWNLSSLLGAEDLLYNGGDKDAVLDLMYSLSPLSEPTSEQQKRAAFWSSRIAALISPQVVREDPGVYFSGREYLAKITGWLVNIIRSPGLSTLERVECARVLAILGDPRRELLENHQSFVEINPGSFQMGSRTNIDALGVETPKHTCEITRAYSIGRFPITNAQFMLFVREGGYSRASYWTEAEAAGFWSQGLVRGSRDNSPRAQPASCGGDSYLPTAPVVGISWFEALAYCRWLGEVLRADGKIDRDEVIDLPSEAEWERAARGDDGRDYPWGGTPQPIHANYFETRVGKVAPVGCFPSGSSPFGVEDLVGNSWEWTRTAWMISDYRQHFAYPYDSSDGREDVSLPNVQRVLRGGSHYSFGHHIRCAIRDVGDPTKWSDNVTFRVVMYIRSEEQR
jgi:formylglycine-generating enzyme required for sulfatase activity